MPGTAKNSRGKPQASGGTKVSHLLEHLANSVKSMKKVTPKQAAEIMVCKMLALLKEKLLLFH